MLEVCAIKNALGGDGHYTVFPSTWKVIKPGEIEITVTCPLDVDGGTSDFRVRYKHDNGYETHFYNTRWAHLEVTAGSQFKLNLEFPEEMFTFVTKLVKKSWIKTVYNNITKLRRNK